MNQTFRSTISIVKACNNLISHNFSDRAKYFEENTVTSFISSDKPVLYKIFDNDELESKFIISEIKKLTSSLSYNYKDIAILYRDHIVSKQLEEALKLSDIPYIKNKYNVKNQISLKTIHSA